MFDAKPASRRSRDWMVLLTRDLEASLSGLAFQLFFDMVAGAARPAATCAWRSEF